MQLPPWRDPDRLEAGHILRLPVSFPQPLFRGEAAAIQATYRRFALRWHPDRNAGSAEAARVFAHLTALRDAALADRGRPAGRCAYHRRFTTTVGQGFLSQRQLCWQLDRAHEHFAWPTRRIIEGFRFADAAMAADIRPWLPQMLDRDILQVTPDLILLRDLVTYAGGRLPPEHVAWIIGSLCNLACWLSWAGLTHNAIDLDSVFISPDRHGAALLGGWWHSLPLGAPLISLPAAQAALLPAEMRATRRAGPALDLESIKAIGRAALGDASGGSLLRDPSLPQPMVDWLTIPGGADPVAEYQGWQIARDASFPRRFVPLPVTAGDIYLHS